MKIIDILNSKPVTLSFEVFPPKSDITYESVKEATLQIAKLSPDFMSVTYGAGGATDKYTADIAGEIQKNNVPALAHLTCIGMNRERIEVSLTKLKGLGIENVLALRGDLPEGATMESKDFSYASQLVQEIKDFGDFCVGAACYPEGHTESESQSEDIIHLKEKVDMGVDFLTTQMFFDNNTLYKFLYKIREKGITVPVLAGIMPVTNGKQIKRICKLSGTSLPTKFRMIVEKFGDDPAAMTQAGITYACEQIIDLIANGIRGVHVYSMNKPEVAQTIKNNLSEII
ncbi:MAG: methylenetetrahydrofolate reductase [NAD(P)H] [Clostridiales bacterium]|nr:methylenetetrahydrofolate reductase [NAD(P)H] [Clostridiales bacterium]